LFEVYNNNLSRQWNGEHHVYFLVYKCFITLHRLRTPRGLCASFNYIQILLIIPSSGILRRVALVRTDVSEERSASIIRVTRTDKLGTLAVTSNLLVTLMMEALFSSKTSVLTKATRRKTPEDYILHSLCRENLKSYIAFFGWAM
jgi:hypothetical protein